jgi:hypothetical protein
MRRLMRHDLQTLLPRSRRIPGLDSSKGPPPGQKRTATRIHTLDRFFDLPVRFRSRRGAIRTTNMQRTSAPPRPLIRVHNRCRNRHLRRQTSHKNDKPVDKPVPEPRRGSPSSSNQALETTKFETRQSGRKQAAKNSFSFFRPRPRTRFNAESLVGRGNKVDAEDLQKSCFRLHLLTVYPSMERRRHRKFCRRLDLLGIMFYRPRSMFVGRGKSFVFFCAPQPRPQRRHWRLKCVSNKLSPSSLVTWLLPQYAKSKLRERL